jgi:hypothetical protein
MGRKLPDTCKTAEHAHRARGVVASHALVVAFAFVACAVDDRPLALHPGLQLFGAGQGGTSDVPGAGGTSDGESGGLAGQAGQTATGGSGDLGVGGSEKAGTAGMSGGTAATGAISGGAAGNGGTSGLSSGGMGALFGPCPDLDGDGVGDCMETVITNAAFDSDTSGWSSDTNVSLIWIVEDAGGQTKSGSLGVTNTYEATQDGTLMVGARQCQPINGASVYDFFVQVSVPAEAPDTRGGFQIILFDGPKCTGNILDARTSNLTQGSAWQLAYLTYLTPTDSKSVAYRLVSVKPFVQPPVTVLFDNVLMRSD